jgi:hypothetical protein
MTTEELRNTIEEIIEAADSVWREYGGTRRGWKETFSVLRAAPDLLDTCEYVSSHLRQLDNALRVVISKTKAQP